MLIEQSTPLDVFSLEDDQRDSLGRGDIFERIPVNHEQVGVVALLDGTNSLFSPHQLATFAVKRVFFP